MTNRIETRELLPLIEEKLAQGGTVTLTVTGNSMFPFLRGDRDRVTIAPLTRPLRVNDVLLYLRTENTLVLHRVIRVDRDGRFTCCGDHQRQPESGLLPEQILGLAISFERRGCHIRARSLRYRIVSALWRWLLPVRMPLLRLAHRLHRLVTKERSV